MSDDTNEWANEQPAPAEGRQDPAHHPAKAGTYAASNAYYEWINAGRPWNPARPIAELTQTLRNRGYTVYILGDDSHATSVPPEDHMPYSATGWPVASPRWYIHACDIMPPAAGSGLPDLGRLAQQLVADKDAGAAPWIKYLNVSLPGQPCQHISWQPGKAVTGSNDAGHIHLSIRSDCTQTSIGGYDPVARIHNPAPAPAPVPAGKPYPLQYPPHVFGPKADPRANVHGGAYDWEVPSVRAIQQRLQALGFAPKYAGWADGIWEQPTTDVVRVFQAARRLNVDGFVGPATWKALFG